MLNFEPDIPDDKQIFSHALSKDAMDVFGGIDVVVVIPAYKQPALLGEAIESVLNQKTALRIAIVIVDDGCPMLQTREVGQSYARAYLKRVFYLRRENGGLSAARNTGVAYALGNFYDFRAVFFLDADNRLFPDFIQRGFEVLESSDANVGWVYPDVDMFGMCENYSVRGEYSLFMHLLENFCEAGSLVRRSVLDSGVRFDENMRHGFEDWDFWLQAAARGFKGRHLPQWGFRYRRRAESMLSNSERNRALILAYMRDKHRNLLEIHKLIETEAVERPRFSVYILDLDRVEFLVDPTVSASNVKTLTGNRNRFVDFCRYPKVYSYPEYICFGSSLTFRTLNFYKVVRNVFWLAQLNLEMCHFVIVDIISTPKSELSVRISVDDVDGDDLDAASVVFVRTDKFRECVLDSSSLWVRSGGKDKSGPSLAKITMCLPGYDEMEWLHDLQQDPAFIAQAALDEADTLRKLCRRQTSMASEWREDARRPRDSVLPSYEIFHNTRHVFPHVASRSSIDIGFILPIFSFGGVEKVILNYARELRKRGFLPHLFVTGTRGINFDLDMAEIFESVNFVDSDDVEAANWNDGYFGTWSSAYGASLGSSRFVGLLATMQIVLNTHSLGAHAVMARLRTLGIKTYLGLHLVERVTFDQPLGNPHVALAYEHAYDGFVVISEQLRAWCIGQGIPREKVFLAPNAPSYASSPTRIAESLLERRGRSAGALNVAYLGRLDFQKGLDRLEAVVRRTRSKLIQWRVVGKSIIDEDPDTFYDLGQRLEPPLASGADLDQLYGWADVVVLCSRFEGVPLTILEAQRFGCVALATDVGAVSEIVTHGVDGLLVSAQQSEEQIISDFVSWLQELASNRRQVDEIGAAAAERSSKLNWSVTMAGWVEAMLLTRKPRVGL